ncbi:MAG: FeoB small GTPase domain-containing protein, partial [Dehalococcoidia bacterium]|nr:FeoB small GTPase domain-containing protein [Dehalococcoidia bacterium]
MKGRAGGKTGRKILLVGNPNVGKSVIFHHLTGKYAQVSNYPGTTVMVTSGNASFGDGSVVIDSPGANSLSPRSE